MLNTPYQTRFEVEYINQNGDKDTVVANYYLENNSILYVSNENWELEVIKPINYHIKLEKVEEKLR